MNDVETIGVVCFVCTVSFILGIFFKEISQSLEYKDKPLFLQSLFSVLSIVFMLIGFPYWGIFEVLTWETQNLLGACLQRQDEQIKKLNWKIEDLERELKKAKESCDKSWQKGYDTGFEDALENPDVLR